ncbi:MAG: T9SS type A sorting domain-containing protein, partial [Sphingobacteriia bacterium]|nr:T9SS type A sorting domain-containing protein [Sphingobacteriia bacterium]
TLSFWGIDKIQALFSDTLLYYDQYPVYRCLHDFNPQVSNPEFRIITDTANWTKVEGSFIAKGGEEYLMIGNYTPWIETNSILIRQIEVTGLIITSYYFFDDVAVYEDGTPVFVANIGIKDTCINKGVPIMLGGLPKEEYLYWWYDSHESLISRQSSITVYPTQDTSFVLVQKDFKFDETSDTVHIKVGNCLPLPPDYSHYDFAIYPNPNNGDFQVRFNTAVPDGAVLELYDLLGRKIAKFPLSGSGNIANISGVDVAAAIYYATVVVPNSFRKSVKMVIMK